MKKSKSENMTFGEHLEVLRKMLFRILAVTMCFAIAIFCFKDETFSILLAPSEWDFITFRHIESISQAIGLNFHIDEYHINLIATELSSQFMTHLSTSLYLALLIASPYILFELFCFISPALYANERKYSVKIAIAIYILFIAGVLISYFLIFPISFHFLGTYQVSSIVTSNITLKSYISTFTTLTFVLGLVFQLPVVAFFMGKVGIINSEIMSNYRRHALLLILIVSAIITPSVDIFTLLLVSTPIYLLYEASIHIVKKVESKPSLQ